MCNNHVVSIESRYTHQRKAIGCPASRYESPLLNHDHDHGYGYGYEDHKVTVQKVFDPYPLGANYP